MRKLFALLMALTMTVQLVMPAWAETVQDEPEESLAAVEEVQETEEATEVEEAPEETEETTEETGAETTESVEDATEAESEPEETTEEPTEETAEPTEIGEEAEDEQVAAVVALIEALPSVEELEGMSEEEQLAAYEQIQGAFEAYDALTDEQKAQIPGAESLFESFFDYLNTQITDFAYSDSYQCGPSLFYNFSSSSGTLSFSGSGTMDNFVYDTIPWRRNNDAITSIVIPEGVTSIGNYAFYGCSKLKSVSLPSTLKSIGDEAFDGCTWLENISIPDGVTRIAKKAFYQCRNLTNVELPSSLKSIGEEAFTECKNLYSVSIPYGTETLEDGAFARCDRLTYVLIPDTVETIGNWAFTDCIALKVADIPQNVKIIGERAFKSCRKLETEVELKQITDLGEQAFYDCEKITSLIISSSITEIPNLAFNSCYALQSVTLPDSVTRIGDLAFCGGVFSTFQNPKGLKSVGHSAFAVCKNLTSYVIPDGMTTIGRTLFQKCSSLSQVVIPGSVTLVETSAFDGCTSLTDIQFGGSQEDWNNISFGSSNTPVFSANIHYSTQATALGFGTHGSNISWKITLDGVLQLSGLGKMDAGTGTELKEFPWTEYSKKITAVEIQPGITSIAAYAFDGIQVEVSIPLSVTEIGRNAISASKLPNYSGTTAQWLAVNFDLAAGNTHGIGAICNDGTVLDLGACGDFTLEGNARYALTVNGCLRIYGTGMVTSAPWILYKDKITTVTIEEGITSVCENAFQNCTKLAAVTLPESVTNVESGAFDGCAGLKTVHYAGTKEQWSQVQIGENNQSLRNAALVYPQSHVCTLEKVEEVPATCKKAGTIAHWRCAVCGKLFSDAEGSTELKVRDTVSAPVDHTIDSTTGKCTVCGLIGGKCGKTVSWALEASGVLRIYGAGEMSTNKGNIAWTKYAESITSIVIESGVTRIDKSAFSYTNCAKGTIIYIPLSVTRMDTPIEQSNLVYHYAGTIAQWRAISFYYADNYWEAPGAECTDGTIVTMGYCGTISKGPFYYLDGEGCLHIDGSGPISFYKYYYYRSYWENYSNQIRTVVIGDGVTSIPSYAFNNLHKLEHISIPEGITCIRDSFKDTDALKEIKLPSTLDRIENSAFENSGLESIIIPEGVTSLSDKSFYGCKNLKSVQLPSTLRNLYEGYTFAYCINLTRINFPENLDHISQYAFQGSGIRSAKLPEGLTWIGASAFSKCGNLTYVSVPASATRIDGGAFADNPRLSKVDFQAKVDSLPGGIFENCPALTSFVIPDGVTTIGNAAFSESGLKTVTIPITVTKIEDNAFASTSLTDVYFDGSQVEWEKITVGSGNDALKKANVHFARVHVCQPEKVADRIEPTCTTAGKLEYWRCDGCGKLYDDANCTNELTQEQLTIPKLGHNMAKTEAVEPTYWNAGNNAYYTCARCGKVYKDEAGKTETTVEAETLEKLASVASGKSGNLNWALTEDGTLTISGSGAMPDYSTSSMAPWYSKRTKILSVIVEPGVTSIGAYAFYACLKLAEVELPEGITYIGESAFQDCAKLKAVEIPKGVEYIRSNAFRGCTGLTGVNIPDGVTSIGYYAFYGCSNLVSVRIPNGVTSIEYGSFYDCKSLTNVSIPDSVTNIGTNAFQGCSSLTSVSIPDSVTNIGYSAFYGCKSLESMSIPEGVTSIESSTFYGCSSLVSVSIPESITGIGGSAFQNCSSLTSVDIPEGVMSIGGYAFENCSSLTSISIPEGVTSIEYRTFYNCTSLENVTLPEGLLGIANSYNGGVFENCTSLKSIVIPDSVTSIGDSAFENCGSLKSVHLSNSVTSIDKWTFENCTNLTSINIPNNVTSIGVSAFENCTSLTKIEIPESVTSLGYRAFSGCTALTSADILGKITELQYETFYNCTNLESVTLSDGLLKIGGPTPGVDNHYGAFGNCSSLKEIVIPDSVTSIAPRAFENCSSLVSIRIPDGVTVIEYATFWNCTSLESVTLPAKLQKMGMSSRVGPFEGCTALKSITIPDGTEIIDYGVFDGCNSLTTVSIPQSVTKIGNTAFWGCSNLKDVYYGGDEVAWKQIDGWDELPSSAYLHYGLTHICTTHLIPAVAPTCTTAGNNAYYLCDACGRVYKDEQNREQTTVEDETLPALGHAMTLTEAKAATCTEDGNNAYYTCGNCHKVFLDEQGEKETTAQAEILPALGHSISIVNTVAPTCTEKGNRLYYTCATCGKAFKDKAGLEATTPAAETVPALGHSMVKTDAVAPTCTEKGSNAYYTCETCEKVFKDALGKQETTVEAEVLEALGHSMVLTEAKDATCTETGNKAYYTCKTCGKVYQDEAGEKTTTVAAETIPALGHTMTKTEAVAPTCTEPGNNAYYTCETCHKVYKDEAGKQETTAQAEILKALGHAMNRTEPKAPTCTTAGTNGYYTCGTCHKVFQDAAGSRETTVEAEVLAALGHSMTKTEAKAPTCTESGNNAYYTCTTCHGVYKDEAGKQSTTVSAEQLAAFGHSMVRTAAKEATCTTDGNNTYYTCRTCGKVYKDLQGTEETTVKAETVAALGHTMEKTAAVAPTCTESGNNTYYTCSTCQKVFKDQQGKQETTVKAETLAVLGHSMVRTEAEAPTCTESGNNAYYTCKTCRKVFKDEAGQEETTVQNETLDALGHSMTKTEAVAPSCTESGNNAYYTCETCHKVFKDEAGKRLTTVSAETLAAFGHSMVKTAAKEATCGETGNNTYYTCKTCGKVYQDEAGEKETTIPAETIPAFGHTMEKTEAVVPTCTTSGNNAYYTCSTCHKVYKDEEGKQETTVQGEFLPALGHDMVETPAVAPTHTTGGNNAYYTCKTCHKVFADEKGTTETTPEREQLPRLPGIADGRSGSLTWILSDEGTLTVSGKGRMPDYSGSALAPWYDYREKIAALEVEEGVQSIGDYAFFDCENLKTIQLPKSLTKLGKSCFVGCDSLALLDLTRVPTELTEKVTDLKGLAVLPETLSKLAGAKASFQWSLETVDGQKPAGTLARLEGSQLTVLRSGTFRLVCLEEYTGLEASVQAAAQTTTMIRPEEREQLTSGERLELSAWAMPFETKLTADWSLTEGSQAYAAVTKDGTLMAKSVTKPVQITVKAAPRNGEEGAEKTLWILPKTIGMGILADGRLVGDSLTAELTEQTELTLTAQIQPQGAKTEVTWTSSREDVAEIDGTGHVKLLKPGTTVIRGESLDGSGVAAELTLKVQYLDGAQTLTLTADADEAGLELGRTAQLTLSGEAPIDPEHVEFQILRGSWTTVDENGVLTAGNVPEKVTVVAALKDDPLQRRAQLTVDIVPVLIRALKLEPQVSQEWGYAEETSGESWVYGEVEAVAGQNRTFQINAQGKDHREHWTEAANLTFESSDLTVARVDAKGLVTLTAREAGECVITVRCTDTLGTEARLHIVLQDSAPRLESTKLTLNSYLNAGISTGLVESCGNTIQSVTLYDYNKTTKRYEEAPSESFAAEAEDGTLTVRVLKVQDKGTYQLKLVVDCLGGSYDFTLQVKVANSLPKVTVKQTGKFDTFYLDSTAQLTATAAGCQVERMELTGTNTFRMDEDGNLFYAESYNPGDKPVTNGKLLVYLEGYQVPVEKSVTIATTRTTPKLTLNPTASAVNTALDDPEFRVKVLWNGKALDLTDADVTANVGFATVATEGQYLVFRLTGTTGGTAKLSLRLPGWAQAVSLTHKITVNTKLPTVKLGTPTLKLNSLFSAQTAETSVWLTQGNLDISTMDFVSAREEGERIALSFDPETDTIEAKFLAIPKAGTYSYTYTAYLEDGTALPSGTLKVTVAAAAPKVKLSAASVKLNRYLAGQEKATVKVTLTGGTGYQVTDFEGLPEYMSYEAGSGELTVILPDGNFTGETCNLYPIVRDEESGQEVRLSTKLTLKVQTVNTSKLTVSLSAKGKLDTVNPDSAIAYTVTKVNNCLGTVDDVSLEGTDGNLFQAELDTSGAKPVVLLRLLPGESYATNQTYKVQFRFTVCGVEALSPVQSVKVTQTALKVTAPKSAVYYLSQSAPLRCSLTANVPLESVALNAKTAKEFQQALGGEENLRLVGNRLEFRLTNPGALTVGKSYSVQLELLPENAAENTKPTTVKLTVKVMK